MAAAKMHASFWMHEDLTIFPWAKGLDWMRGEGKERWEASLAAMSVGEELYGPEKDLKIFDNPLIPEGW